MEKTKIPPVIQRSIRPYHRGNGPLRGGGMTAMYGVSPNMKNYKRKLDNRLGYCIFACQITIATILVVYGLIHQYTHDELVNYIITTKEIIINSMPTIEPTQEQKEPMQLIEISSNFTDTSFSANEQSLVEPESCLGAIDVDTEKCLTVDELQEDYDMLHGSNITLWNLATLNIIVALFLITVTCVFANGIVKGTAVKMFYRVTLFMALFFMLIQLIYLINPLFTSAFQYSPLVDKLLIKKLPRDRNAMLEIESHFACQFDTIDKLVEMGLEESCLPKIKNNLLPVYSVVLLIAIDLIPFSFVLFTYAWDACLKESHLINNARRRIELNNQRRPQSREDILKKAMEDPNYV